MAIRKSNGGMRFRSATLANSDSTEQILRKVNKYLNARSPMDTEANEPKSVPIVRVSVPVPKITVDTLADVIDPEQLKPGEILPIEAIFGQASHVKLAGVEGRILKGTVRVNKDGQLEVMAGSESESSAFDKVAEDEQTSY